MAKAKFPNISSFFRNNSQTRSGTKPEDVVMEGSLAKMENGKIKYFVLRRGNEESPACLEYYENVDKFKDACQPRKRYLMKDCFISRITTEKKQYGFALFIKKKCKTLIANCEEDLLKWLEKMLELKREISGCNNSGNIEYQRIWSVEIMNRGLASSQKLAGELLVCLNNWSLWLMNSADDMREIPLNSIRNYGRINKFFFLEVGRHSGIGAGNLWMKTEDSYIAQNMIDIIVDALNKFEAFPQLKDSLDMDFVLQRPRINSETGSRPTSGCPGGRARNRTYTDTTHLPHIVTSGGAFWRSPNGPFDATLSPRDGSGSARLPTSSEEDIRSRLENEYVEMTSGNAGSPSIVFRSSPISGYISDIQPGVNSSVNAYLDMGPSTSTSAPNTANRLASTPIPIVNNSESLRHEISSGNSSAATSATTSSDHMPDLDGTSGSESVPGSSFGASELLDRPIRTSSVGSKIEHYKRKNSAPLLAWSPASHSWSGTAGTYFRNVPEMFPQPKKDTMMIDYSHSSSAHDGAQKKRFWSTFGGQKRTGAASSKPSSSARCSNGKICDAKDQSLEQLPDKKRSSDDYCQFDYQVKISGPPVESASSSKADYLSMTKARSSGNSLDRKIRLDRSYLEMSPTADPTISGGGGTADGYVVMSHSGSSLSISEPVASSAPTRSDFNALRQESALQHHHEGTDKTGPKNNHHKKATKSKSMKECTGSSGSSKRSNKADPHADKVVVVPAKSKAGGGTFSAFNRMIRKTSITKSPVTQLPQPQTTKRSPPSPVSGGQGGRLFPPAAPTVPVGGGVSPSSCSGFVSSPHERQEEKMLFVPRDDPMPGTQLRRISELCAVTDVDRGGGPENRTRHSLTDTPDSAVGSRNYVNLRSLNAASSPQISQYGRRQPSVDDVASSAAADAHRTTDGYLLMTSTAIGGPVPASADRCGTAERSRSFSGPGQPVPDSQSGDAAQRTTSARSSPTPGLGSISSISSAGDGGLSSGSSTCTVVNVGTARAKCPSGGGGGGGPADGKPPAAAASDKLRPASLNINYASLDLSKTPEGSPRPARSGRDAAQESNYCEVDFVKSEGLRNTALARNSTIH